MKFYRIPYALMAAATLLAPAAFAKVSVSTQGNVTTMRFVVDDITFKGAPNPQKSGLALKKAHLIGVDGYEGITFEIGAPEVPVIRFYADGDVSVQMDSQTKAGHLNQAERLAPSQPPHSKSAEAPAFVMNTAAYANKSLAKASYSIAAAGSINGIPRQLVTLYPLAYAPGSGDWQLRPSFKVQVTHAKKNKTAVDGRDIFAFVVGHRFVSSPSLAAYVALKKKLGFQVEIIDVASGDTPDTIRAKLQSLYKRPDGHLKYALIIGEAADVPAHESDNISGVTDHYYRAIDTDNYDADINGPDIGVGRVSVDSGDQLDAVLSKFTRYTEGAFAEEGWLNQVAFIATDDRYQVAEGTHNYVVSTHTAPKRYTGVFPAANQDGGDKLYPVTYHVTDSKVVEVMNQGRTIIEYSGHGSNTSWAGPNISQSDVRSLTNANALPFVIGNACITGDFRVAESFAETWQRHPAGAITYWGSMDSTYWDEDDLLERYMFDHIYRDGALAFGDVTSYALGEVWRNYGGNGKSKYYWETYHVFGDPSLDLRTTHTRRVTVAGPQALPIGVDHVEYKVSDANGPVVGVRVALGDVTGTPTALLAGVTDADGKVSFDLAATAQAVKTLQVVVSGQNTVLAENALQIIPAENPYLSFSSYTIADRTEQTLYVGETASLTFNIQNLGLQPTQGGTITAENVTGPAQLINKTAAFGPLAARDTFRIPADSLSLKVNDDARSGDSVTMDLKWTTNEGQTATVTVTLHVLRAQLRIEAVDFGSASGILPGQSGEVYVTVKNTGTEIIHGGAFSAESGACVSAVTGNLAIDNLAPGASTRVASPLTVSIDAACVNGNAALVRIVGRYQSVAHAIDLDATATFSVGALVTITRALDNLHLQILDNETAEQPIEANMMGTIESVGVHVKLTHTYMGDLVISLVHPDGTRITLQDRQGASGSNLDVTFGLGGQDVGELAKLKGKPATGTWKLLIEDTANQDEGTLNEVALSIKGYVSGT